MESDPTQLEARLAAAEKEAAAAIAARDGALRELDSLRTRIDSAEAIHKRSHQRESEHQKTIDALAAAELNLKAARIAEAQASTRAAAAEAALTRSGIAPGQEADLVLQKQLGEARRLEAAATAEAADLRAKLAEAREQVTAVASDSALAAVREAAGKAQAELQAVNAQNAWLRRELDTAGARIAQLESAAVTIQARLSGPPPELAEARAEAEKARNAARSAEGSLNRLRRDLADAKTRITGLETTLAATRQASALNVSAATELAAFKKQADQIRSDLLAVSEENRRLRNELSGRGQPRPPREPRPARTPEPAPSPSPAGSVEPAESAAPPEPEGSTTPPAPAVDAPGETPPLTLP